jgi:hypothetical protein
VPLDTFFSDLSFLDFIFYLQDTDYTLKLCVQKKLTTVAELGQAGIAGALPSIPRPRREDRCSDRLPGAPPLMIWSKAARLDAVDCRGRYRGNEVHFYAIRSFRIAPEAAIPV